MLKHIVTFRSSGDYMTANVSFDSLCNVFRVLYCEHGEANRAECFDSKSAAENAACEFVNSDIIESIV